ncbi:LytR C-terminal domain-containing protein [Thalassiella azotivora]
MAGRGWGRDGSDDGAGEGAGDDPDVDRPWDLTGPGPDTDVEGVPDPGLDDEAEWTEEDERRYQARREAERVRLRRRRRQAVAFGVVVLAVLAVGVGAYGVWTGRWEWPGGQDAATAEEPCPTPSPTAAQESDVTVVVLNATDVAGIAGQVAAELQARGMTVRDIGNDRSGVFPGVQVRHGPQGLPFARTVAAHVSGTTLLDDGRSGAVVELSIGAGFAGMTPVEEAERLTAPPVPEGCGTPSATAPAPTDPAATGEPSAEGEPTDG